MKFKLRSFGKTVDKTPMAVEGKPKTHTYYPSISLTSAQIPLLGDCKIGEKYRLVAEVEVKGIQKGEEWGSEKGSRADLELKKGVLLPSSKSDTYESAAHETKEEV